MAKSAAAGFLGLRRIFKKQKPRPNMSAIKAINPTPRPAADALLRRDVGSEPSPPKVGAAMTLTHRPSEHVLSFAQSLATKHVPNDSEDVFATLDVRALSVAEALDAELVV